MFSLALFKREMKANITLLTIIYLSINDVYCFDCVHV